MGVASGWKLRINSNTFKTPSKQKYWKNFSSVNKVEFKKRLHNVSNSKGSVSPVRVNKNMIDVPSVLDKVNSNLNQSPVKTK